MLTVWEASLLLVVPYFGLFLVVEGAFWSANIIKASSAAMQRSHTAADLHRPVPSAGLHAGHASHAFHC